MLIDAINQKTETTKESNAQPEKKVYKWLYLYGYVFVLSLGGFNIGKENKNYRV